MAQAVEFDITPTQAQLDAIERELRFFAAANDNPATLTREQIREYNERGYLKPFRAYCGAEIATIRAEFDRLLKAQLAAGKDSYSISSAHLRHAVAHDILTNPTIVAHVRDLLGPNVIGWGSHFFCKMPGDGKRVSWHQDAAYWPLTPTKSCTVWLAIDDADSGNGCMRFIPGSHRSGVIETAASAAEEGNVLDQTVQGAERFGEPVDDELRAGEFSLHADLLLHGSEPNDSERRRCGLTLRYCAADVRAHLDWNQKGVFVAGADVSGHWANRARPSN
jgi:hypothetical protein